MPSISVVIITKNEAAIIKRTIAACLQFSDDILVADTGSVDETCALAEQAGARVVQIQWQGYGASKHAAVLLAKHNWVLSIDADEIPDTKLQNELIHINLHSIPANTLISLRFNNYVLEQKMKYGMWRSFSKVRMFNKSFANWNQNQAHEGIIFEGKANNLSLNGILQHFSVKDLAGYNQKMQDYAQRMAKMYFEKGKNASWFKIYLYPCWVLFQILVLKAGFLDGWLGYATAKLYAHYVFLKYNLLKEHRFFAKNAQK